MAAIYTIVIGGYTIPTIYSKLFLDEIFKKINKTSNKLFQMRNIAKLFLYFII